jgi:hypothetical protein
MMSGIRMSNVEVDLFKDALNCAEHYLEYGAGGSTRLAAGADGVVSIKSVESDPDFINEMLRDDLAIKEAERSGKLQFITVNVGETGAWGHPQSTLKSHLWPQYVLCPYTFDYSPDLVLIDGRFRVACALCSALQAPEATVLIHDYPPRKQYHVIEKFFEIERRVDTIVVCKRRSRIDEAQLKRLLKAYLYAPDDLVPSRRVRIMNNVVDLLRVLMAR